MSSELSFTCHGLCWFRNIFVYFLVPISSEAPASDRLKSAKFALHVGWNTTITLSKAEAFTLSKAEALRICISKLEFGNEKQPV